jgi:ABC-type antimicrobial peptide transport system permease subunit
LTFIRVYAVVSYTTAQRTLEIGVRLALGAQRADIRLLVVLNGAGVAAVGIVAGAAGAYALARYAASMLYEVRPADPATYVSLGGFVLAIAAAAAWAPARRAQRVDPVRVLRNE